MKIYNFFVLLSIFILSALLIFSNAVSQSFSDIYFVKPPKENNYNILQKLFNNHDSTNNGTVVAPSERKGRQYVQKSLAGDSSKKDNRVEIRESENGDEFYVVLDLTDYNQHVKISVYNMLAKKILDVFDGTPVKDERYKIDTTNLPNGIYICVVQGNSIRLAQKFIVSR